MKDICIATVTMHSVVGKTKKNIDKIKYWVCEANKLGAEIVCFPELSITGYSINSIKSLAISYDDCRIKGLCEIANKMDIIIMPGMIEKDISGKIYATHMIIAPNNKIGRYRKIHIPHVEKELLNGGNSFSIFKTTKINIGLQLCYDSHFPEISTCLSEGGAEVIFIPHASPRGNAESKNISWKRHLTARAFDNGVFIVACNQTGNNGEGLNFPGNALIISPSGKIMKEKLTSYEGILTAHLKVKQMNYVHQHKMRYFLPNRKPEIYRETPILKTLI